MSRKRSVGALAGFVVLVAATVAASAGTARSATAGVTPLPSSSCGPVVYKGSGSPDYIVATDLPLQGASRHQTVQISRAASVGSGQPWLEGRPVQDRLPVLRRLDRAGGRLGHGQVRHERAPVREQPLRARRRRDVQLGLREDHHPDPQPREPGPLAIVSPANTSPGITTTGPGADPGEPNKYYPTGKRNYARVVANDQFQGAGRRDVHEVARRQEGVRPERQADVRLRRRAHVLERGEEARHESRRLQGLGREADQLRGARERDQEVGRPGRVPRRHRRQQRPEADAGHQVGRSEDQAPDAGRLQRPERERLGRQRRASSASPARRRRS